MITISVFREGKTISRFNFAVCVDGQEHETLTLNALSKDCVKIVAPDCAARVQLNEDINTAISEKAYEMGYKRMVFTAPPEQEVTRTARLQRKATDHWAYVIPLEELYGGNN